MLVELQRPSADSEHIPPVQRVLERCAEPGAGATYLEYCLLHLVNLGFGESLDGAKFSLRSHLDASNSADACRLQLLNVCNVDSMALE